MEVFVLGHQQTSVAAGGLPNEQIRGTTESKQTNMKRVRIQVGQGLTQPLR